VSGPCSPCPLPVNLQGCCRTHQQTVGALQTADPSHVAFLHVSAGGAPHLCSSAAGKSTPAPPAQRLLQSCSRLPCQHRRPACQRSPAVSPHQLLHTPSPCGVLCCAVLCHSGCARQGPWQALAPTPRQNPKTRPRVPQGLPKGLPQPRCCDRDAPRDPAPGPSCRSLHPKHGTAGLRQHRDHHQADLEPNCKVSGNPSPACPLSCCSCCSAVSLAFDGRLAGVRVHTPCGCC
jgi:hypothetical protein